MGKVVFNMSMSLDGFVAGPNDSPDNSLGDGGERLFKWYSLGDTGYMVPGGDRELKLSPDSARFLKEVGRTVGVIVYGRRTFDIARAWNGRHPMNIPMVIVTHRVPQEWVREGSPFTFVSDGVESAIEKAGEIAGDRNIAIGSASILQQLLKVGLLDGIRIDLVPVLLGAGIRLFDHLGTGPIELESTGVTVAPGVTHLDFRVIK